MDTHSDSPEVESLLQAAEQGDRSALNTLMDMHRDFLRRVVELRLDRALRGRVDTSDNIQETQLVVANRIAVYIARRPTSFKLWLRGEALQQIGMQYRRHVMATKRSVQRECHLSNASSLQIARNLLRGTPSQILQRQETVERVRQIIENLPPTDREIVLLRYVEGLTNAEAADLLAIEPATARKRHGRALKRLYGLMVEERFIDVEKLS